MLKAITSYAARRRGARDRLTELILGSAQRGSRSRVRDLVEDGSWHGAGDPLQDLAASEEEDRRNRPDAVPVRKPGGSSTFTLARITRPPEFAARSSRTGAIAWHGAHQSAEKSTMSSPSLAATTSSKVFSVRCIGAVRFDRFTIVWSLVCFQMSTDASRVPDAHRNETSRSQGRHSPSEEQNQHGGKEQASRTPSFGAAVATSVSSPIVLVLMRCIEARGHVGDRPRGVEFDDV
jgi:hypothetical protein